MASNAVSHIFESMHVRPVPNKPEEDTVHPITDREHVSNCEKVELDPG